MFRIIMVCLLAVGLLDAKMYDGVAVVVQDKVITLYDIESMMQETHLDVKKATDLLIRKKLEAIEMHNRNISVSDAEVYDEIRTMATRNKMSVSEFYDAVREANGLSSAELKKKIRQKLLTQKLYNAIVMSSIEQPSEDEIQEYYQLHKQTLAHPQAFLVKIYDTQDRAKLEAKTRNPMLYTPDIATNEQKLPYSRISPELANLLEKTPLYHFTSVIPNGRGGFMSFYLEGVEKNTNPSLESLRNEIQNALMAQKRESVLSNYFAHLKDNTKITIVRLPKE